MKRTTTQGGGGGGALNISNIGQLASGVLGDLATYQVLKGVKAPTKIKRDVFVPNQVLIKQRVVSAAPKQSLNPMFSEIDKTAKNAIQSASNLADPRMKRVIESNVLAESLKQKLSVGAQVDAAHSRDIAQAEATNAQLGLQTDAQNAQITSQNIKSQIYNEEAQLAHNLQQEDQQYQYNRWQQANWARMTQNITQRVGDFSIGIGVNAEFDRLDERLKNKERQHARSKGLDIMDVDDDRSFRTFSRNRNRLNTPPKQD